MAVVARLLGRKLRAGTLAEGWRGVTQRGVPLDFLPVSEKSESATSLRQLRGASCGDWEGVERPWRRSHGANLNRATAVFPAVAVSAKPSHVSDRFTATTAAMETASLRCACHCDIVASRPRDVVRQRRSLDSGNPTRKLRKGRNGLEASRVRRAFGRAIRIAARTRHVVRALDSYALLVVGPRPPGLRRLRVIRTLDRRVINNVPV